MSRLFDLLDTFTDSENREFRKYLASPFFNQREDVQILFDIWEKSRKKGIEMLDKAPLFRLIYGNEPFDDQRLRLIHSLLFKHAERYLVHVACEVNKHQFQTCVAQIYRQRNLPEHFQRALKSAKEVHEGSVFRNADYYWQGYELQREEYLFKATSTRVADLNLQHLGEQLDLAFATLKLRQACVALSHQAVFKRNYVLGLLPEVLDFVQEKDIAAQPAIAVYQACYFALTHPEPTYFQQFKQMVFQHGDVFPPDEIRDLYLLAINYCIRKHNDGIAGFLDEEFELYHMGLEKKILLLNGVLSRYTYRNVTTLGIALRKFEWVEQFVQNYKTYLEPRYREANFAFNLARLEYERGHFQVALSLLQQSDYDDLLLNLGSKTVLLKIYYETNAFSALDSHLDAMANFVRRKKELAYHRDNYLALIRFIRRILALPPGDKASLEKVKAELAVANVAEKGWLMRKLAP